MDSDRGPQVVISRRGDELARFTLVVDGLPDFGAVDELCRLRLKAVQRGYDFRVHQACAALAALLQLCGLDAVLAPSVEMGGQGEEGEQRFVEEAVMPSDPPV